MICIKLLFNSDRESAKTVLFMDEEKELQPGASINVYNNIVFASARRSLELISLAVCSVQDKNEQ